MTTITVCPECHAPVVSMNVRTSKVVLHTGDAASEITSATLPCGHHIITAAAPGPPSTDDD